MTVKTGHRSARAASRRPTQHTGKPGCRGVGEFAKGARSVAARLSDAFDEAVGLDSRGPKPITLKGVAAADFDKMEAKVADLEKSAQPLDAQTRRRLDRGDIVTASHARADGLVEEKTIGVIDMPLEQFLQKVPAKDWGKNLVDRKGGEVHPFGPGRQIERMVLRAPGKDLDMTKVETIREDRDPQGKLIGTQVRWEVLKSDNGTVVQDMGTLHFDRYGDKTLVTWHSAHKLNKLGAFSGLIPKSIVDAGTGLVLSDYFKRSLQHYREVSGAGG